MIYNGKSSTGSIPVDSEVLEHQQRGACCSTGPAAESQPVMQQSLSSGHIGSCSREGYVAGLPQSTAMIELSRTRRQDNCKDCMCCTDLICPASCDGALQQEQHFLRGRIQGSQALGQGDAGQDWAPRQLAQQLQMQGSCLSQILRMQVVLPAHTQQYSEGVHPPRHKCHRSRRVLQYSQPNIRPLTAQH